ncbi:MAG: HlyD family secretion protein [Vicinamibacterales bacterium]
MMRMERTVAGAVVALLLQAGCNRTAPPDAYGNVEATEVVVGAEAAGRLVTYTVTEGAVVQAGAVVGTIDATQLGFERDQLAAQQTATRSRIGEVRQQIAALESQRGSSVAQRDAARAQRDALATQLEIAGRAHARTRRLFDQQAATVQQLDQAERDERVLGSQIAAQDEQIKAQERQIAAQADLVRGARAQEQTIAAQLAGAEAQVSQAGERIRKTEVRNPIDGTVLTTYARAGEVVQTGQPLYRVANLTAMEVRAYVTEPQLSAIRLGQEARVSIDSGGGGRQSVSGSISWISARAEFTPTPIQTREERADMVYAIKIRVPNASGVLKIGMPVDVQFVESQAAR